MPYWWFAASVKVVSPLLLTALFVWNMVVLFGQNGGSYGGYPIWAQVIAGWIVSGFVFISGFIAKAIVNKQKKKGFVEDEVTWDSADETVKSPVKTAVKTAPSKTAQKKKRSKKR